MIPSAMAFLMHVRRGQIDDYLSSGYLESHSLKGGDGAEKTFLHGCVGKSYEMYPYALGDVYFDCYVYRIDTDAFCRVDVYQHDISFFQMSASETTKCLKKRKL